MREMKEDKMNRYLRCGKWISFLGAIVMAATIVGCKKKSGKSTEEGSSSPKVARKAERPKGSEEKTEATAETIDEVRVEDIEKEVQEVGEELEDVKETLKAYGSDQREEVLAKMDMALERLDNGIKNIEDQIELKHKQYNDEAYLEFKETLWGIRVMRYELAELYGGLKYGTDAAWEEIKDGFGRAYEELKTAFQEAEKDLGDLEVEYKKPVKVDIPPPKSTGPKAVR